MNRPVLKLLRHKGDLMSSGNTCRPVGVPPSFPENLPDTHGASLIDVEDWDKLFQAIESRLSMAVARGSQSPDEIKATVLDCVEALDQLHQALTFERQQRRQQRRQQLSPAV